MLRQHRSHVLFHSQKPLISIFYACEHMHIIAMAHLGVLDMGVQMFTQILVSDVNHEYSPHMSRTLVGEIRTPNHGWVLFIQTWGLNLSPGKPSFSWIEISFLLSILNYQLIILLIPGYLLICLSFDCTIEPFLVLTYIFISLFIDNSQRISSWIALGTWKSLTSGSVPFPNS